MKHTHLFQTRAKIDYINRCIEVFIYKRGVHVLLTSLSGKKAHPADPETMNFSLQECTSTLTFFSLLNLWYLLTSSNTEYEQVCVWVGGVKGGMLQWVTTLSVPRYSTFHP